MKRLVSLALLVITSTSWTTQNVQAQSPAPNLGSPSEPCHVTIQSVGQNGEWISGSGEAWNPRITVWYNGQQAGQFALREADAAMRLALQLQSEGKCSAVAVPADATANDGLAICHVNVYRSSNKVEVWTRAMRLSEASLSDQNIADARELRDYLVSKRLCRIRPGSNDINYF